MTNAFKTLVTVGLLLVVQGVQAATVTFDDLPIGSAVGYSYAAKGVVFSNVIGVGPFSTDIVPIVPHSGSHLAEIGEGEFETTPISFDFTNGQSHVAVYGCSATTNTEGFLKLFDGSHNIIGQVGPIALIKGTCQALFDFHAPAATIKHGEFSSFINNAPTGAIYLDDLTFDGGQAPPAVPTTNPVVKIANPLASSTVNVATVVLSGMIQGNGLTGTLLANIDHKRMPWDQAPPNSYAIPLTNTGPNAKFALPVNLPLGLVTITATAENIGGKFGTASILFTNLPTEIVSGALGQLTGILDSSPACKVAIYANGALAWDGANAFTIRDRMLPKWIAWVNAARSIDPQKFCPTENAHLAIGTVSRQNFIGGRLYDDTAKVVYVSSVFSQAIDALGGEVAVGVPTADPVASLSAHTWQFQRFVRQQGGLLTTIEIKGSSPTLYVERQGGDLTVLTAAGLSLTPTTATLVDRFSCTGIQGPCAISAPIKTGTSVDGSRYCQGYVYPAVDEWVSILPNGHLVPTPVMGWVTDSGPSNADLATTHEFVFEHSNGAIWSDWTLFVHPLYAYLNLLAANTKMEVEVEYYTAQWLFIANDGQPLDGDLYFASGRWIIDCGHSDYSSEIHPPFVTSRLRTVGTGDAASTSALFWVNGYYYSGQQVQLQLFPPPRPTPTSFLVVSLPNAAEAAYDVTVIDSTDPTFSDADFAAWVSARFTASPKPVSLAYGGRLPFSSGRDYEGTWTVGWQNTTVYQTLTLSDAWWP